MQREIKNKTISYGIAAVLLACILTATVYNFGIQTIIPSDPNVPSDSNTPSQPNTPTQPNTPSVPSFPQQPTVPAVFSELHTFSSHTELETFINENVEAAEQLNYLPFLTRDVPTFGAFVGALEAALTDYSTTNVQVAGVDEADFVKSDGEYLYVISESYIYILKAYPANQAEVVSKIELNGTYDAQLYVNGNKLAVLASYYPFLGNGIVEDIRGEMMIAPYNGEMFVQVYDVTNKTNPVLSKTVILNGTLSGSRMIGDYIYAVVNQAITQPNANGTELEVILPTISGDYDKEILATEISYINATDSYYRLTTIIAVNIMNDAQEPTYEPFLTGQATEMYVSLNNMYLVVPNTNRWFLLDSEDEPKEETLVYRIKLDQDEIVAMNEGAVSGYMLNQFSMDEYNGTFRIATTTNDWWSGEGPNNHLFIMNMNLNVIGKLENLAENETIYSVRFMGDRGYIVTFRKIDPLFVIDLTDPTAPTVLGELKVTGYSDYLHPYDENHIIGIGKETEAAEEGDFAWYQGVKISLFDVSDVSNPVEVAKYEIGDRGTDSPVLYDHKALLFDKEKNLLVIPVRVAEIDPSQYPGEVPDWTYGEYVWQGTYVFDISPDGIELRGTITHMEDGIYLSGSSYEGYFVERSLYIDDVLYTVSDELVKMNDLERLDFIDQIELY